MCPTSYFAQNLCIACRIDRIERYWKIKTVLDDIGRYREWHGVLSSCDALNGSGWMRAEIGVRLWWLRGRADFIEMEVKQCFKVYEYEEMIETGASAGRR